MSDTNKFTEEQQESILAHALKACQLGEILPPETLMITVHVGSASSGTDSYEISQTANGAPLIKHRGTGKFFLLSWHDILHMASAAGIKEPESTH